MENKIIASLIHISNNGYKDKRIDDLTSDDIKFRIALLFKILPEGFIDIQEERYQIPAVNDEHFFEEIVSEKGKNGDMTLLRINTEDSIYDLDMVLEFRDIDTESMYETCRYELFLIKDNKEAAEITCGIANEEARELRFDKLSKWIEYMARR